jgi:hypothetical protein
LAALDHQRRLQRKGRKGGEAAQHADGGEQAKGLTPDIATEGQPAGQQAHQQATDNIDRQRGPGPLRRRKLAHRPDPDPVAGHGPESTPGCDD